MVRLWVYRIYRRWSTPDKLLYSDINQSTLFLDFNGQIKV